MRKRIRDFMADNLGFDESPYVRELQYERIIVMLACLSIPVIMFCVWYFQ